MSPEEPGSGEADKTSHTTDEQATDKHTETCALPHDGKTATEATAAGVQRDAAIDMDTTRTGGEMLPKDNGGALKRFMRSHRTLRSAGVVHGDTLDEEAGTGHARGKRVLKTVFRTPDEKGKPISGCYRVATDLQRYPISACAQVLGYPQLTCAAIKRNTGRPQYADDANFPQLFEPVAQKAR